MLAAEAVSAANPHFYLGTSAGDATAYVTATPWLDCLMELLLPLHALQWELAGPGRFRYRPDGRVFGALPGKGEMWPGDEALVLAVDGNFNELTDKPSYKIVKIESSQDKQSEQLHQ